jgi:hypothetical protein
MADKNEKVESKADDKVDTAQVENIVQKETDQGFRGGEEVDTTPNENYTVAGVTAGKPTPETDEDAAKAVGSPKRFHI